MHYAIIKNVKVLKGHKMTALEKELFAKYKEPRPKTFVICPMTRNRDETKALLNGDMPAGGLKVKSKPVPKEGRAVTAKQAAAIMGVTVETVRARARRGEIKREASTLYNLMSVKAFKKRRPGPRRSTIMTKEQGQRIKDIYESKDFLNNAKPKEQSLFNLAAEFKVSRSTLKRHADKMGLTQGITKKEWSEQEIEALSELAAQYPVPRLETLMRERGFDRSKTSIVIKMNRLGLEMLPSKMQEFNINQLATILGVTRTVVERTLGEEQKVKIGSQWVIRRPDAIAVAHMIAETHTVNRSWTGDTAQAPVNAAWDAQTMQHFQENGKPF